MTMTTIKLKCTKCGFVTDMNLKMLDYICNDLGIEKEDYISIYRCILCRTGRVFNWVAISSIEDLPEHFLDKYANKLLWDFVSSCHILTLEFVTKYIDKLTKSILLNPTFDTLPPAVKLLILSKVGGSYAQTI
jgi:hypothetical protein